MLADAGLRTPTTVLVPNEKGGSLAFDKLGSEYPVILKTNTGARGLRVVMSRGFRVIESFWNKTTSSGFETPGDAFNHFVCHWIILQSDKIS